MKFINIDKLISALIFVFVLLLPVACYSRRISEAQELGHHWEVSAYINELHLQLIAITGLLIIFGVFKIIGRRKRI